MKRQEPESVGDILRLTLQESNMTPKLDECRAVELWPSVMGNIADLCGRPIVRNGVMTVSVRAAPLRHELTMIRSRLVKSLNKAVGRDAITEIRFIS